MTHFQGEKIMNEQNDALTGTALAQLLAEPSST